MPTTNYGWPKPNSTDQPDGPTQIGALADAIDTTLFTFPQPSASYTSTQTLVGSLASVTFSPIPSTLKRLQIFWTARGDAATAANLVLCQVNGNVGSNYRYAYTQAASGPAVTGVVTIPATSMVVGIEPGSTAAAGIFASGLITFSGWDSPHAGYLGQVFQSQFLDTAANFFMVEGGGHLSSAGPYTQITLFPQSGNFIAGSEFAVYGQ